MTTKYGYALHELQFVDDGKKKTVAPGTTVSLPEEIYDDFEKLNALRAATKDEISIAKAKGPVGVTETPAQTDPAVAKADAEAAAAESAKATAKKADAKASEAAAAETDRNREAAKAAATKSDPLA